jgi:hypothetical protein
MADRNISVKRVWNSRQNRAGQILDIPPDDSLARIVLPSEIDPYTTDTVQKFPLGTRLSCNGGQEVYRYALEGGAGVEVGALCQSLVPLAGHINEVCGSSAVGATELDFTPNTVSTDDLVANELAGGYIYIYNGTGEGYKYRVATHPAITGGTSGTLTLYDPIKVATEGLVATVMHSPYYKFLIHPSPPTAMPIGWTVTAVTANHYTWIQTHGPCCSLIDSGGTAVVMGQPCTPSAEDDGAVQMFDPDAATEPNAGIVGWVMEIGADAGGAAATFGFVFATIE